MATIVHLPEIMTGSSEATIQTWLVTPGQEVSVGDPLAEVETDKAVVEMAAETAGTVLKILVEDGAPLAVGTPVVVIGAPGEEPPAEPGTGAIDDTRDRPAEANTLVSATQSEKEATAADTARRFATPLVRKLAREHEIDLSTLTGSGPGGRIVRKDIDRYLEEASRAQTTMPVQEAPVPAPAPAARTAPALPEGATRETPSAMRRAIARRLTESKSTVPHFYLKAECRVDALLELRRTVKDLDIPVSINDFVLKAVAAAFDKVPEANALWTDEAIVRPAGVDIGLAVAVDDGLVTPVIRDVGNTSITGVSLQARELAGRAREGKLRQHEIEGGSFTVSNLGMYGVTEFSAIINPPQSAILAVGTIVQRPVVAEGAIEVGSMMTVMLSADHRVIDGALAGRWMQEFVRVLEHPLSALV
ncbi:dihydrolipoamide acetyltransferase family protein [Streptomyces sp. NPDC060209]|uniref:dihydrolipoamide acetyltransferase family protein n=1 Tax=Streptomyces sp. NPDC060209 TaxID=3347073 RepID=UPI00365D07B4